MEAFLRTILLAVFIPTALYSFMIYDAPVDPRDLWALAGGSFVLAVLFRGRASRASGYSLVEETLLAVLFLAAMWTFRGYKNAVPLLFGFGLSAMLSFLFVHGLRLFTKQNVKLQNLDLRRSGRLTRVGYGFMVFVGALLLVSAKVGWDRQQERAAARIYRSASELLQSGNIIEAEAAFDRAAELDPKIAEQVQTRRDHRVAIETYNYGVQLAQTSNFDGAVVAWEEALRLNPELVPALQNLLGLLMEIGEYDKAARWYEHALELMPGTPEIHEGYARALQELGQKEQAAEHLREAKRLREEAQESKENELQGR